MPTPPFADALAVARRSDDPIVYALTVSHPVFGVYRLVQDSQDLESRGETFKSAWFSVAEVNDDGSLPRVSVSIPNVDPELGQKLLRHPTRPEVTVEAIALSHPDEPIRRAARLELNSLSVKEIISGELVGKDHSAVPVGSIMVRPATFPAIFRRQRKE